MKSRKNLVRNPDDGVDSTLQSSLLSPFPQHVVFSLSFPLPRLERAQCASQMLPARVLSHIGPLIRDLGPSSCVRVASGSVLACFLLGQYTMMTQYRLEGPNGP